MRNLSRREFGRVVVAAATAANLVTTIPAAKPESSRKDFDTATVPGRAAADVRVAGFSVVNPAVVHADVD